MPAAAVSQSLTRTAAHEPATHMLAFEGDSRVVWFEGNCQDYEADRHGRLGTEADQPHRIMYCKLAA